uniref:G_PROTEIN_RECEP_F1_2 domain-containing protein n=1 Tax=Gongylonema pulchrum TaxID=637853 RepID=A0A183E5Q6_9BILA
LKNALKIIWWSNVVCLPAIAVVGLACNLLNILILSTNSSARRIPSWNLLLALATCDCLFLVFATMEVTPSSLSPLLASSSLTVVYIHSALYVRMLASTFYKSSVLSFSSCPTAIFSRLVVTFNVERYIWVCHPLRAHDLCSSRASRTAVVFCLVISLLCSLQWPICYRIRPCWDYHLRQHFYVIAISDNASLQAYYQLMDYLTLATFNVLPIAALCDGTSGHRSAAQRFNANAMLFAVVLMLLVCVGPQAPARLLFAYYGQYHLTTIAYTCITQQVSTFYLFVFLCVFAYVQMQKRKL